MVIWKQKSAVMLFAVKPNTNTINNWFNQSADFGVKMINNAGSAVCQTHFGFPVFARF
jgi:hypothetical protein